VNHHALLEGQDPAADAGLVKGSRRRSCSLSSVGLIGGFGTTPLHTASSAGVPVATSCGMDVGFIDIVWTPND